MIQIFIMLLGAYHMLSNMWLGFEHYLIFIMTCCNLAFLLF